jgi:ribosome maturation factor RimP
MTPELLIKTLHTLVEEALQTPGYEDCFVVEIPPVRGNKVEIFIDADTGIDFDKCRFVSRQIEAHLDTEGWLGEAYTLDVSSPGMSRPLRFPRQYRNHKGRLLKVDLADGSALQGHIVAADETAVTINYETKTKVGKKNVREQVNNVLPYENIRKAVIIPDFRGLIATESANEPID